MAKQRKSQAMRALEELTGGPLTLGGYLRAIREGEELSQAAMAKQLGVTTAHISDVERGTKGVSPQRAARWAELLGYSPRQFVKLAIDDDLARNGLAYTVQLEAC